MEETNSVATDSTGNNAMLAFGFGGLTRNLSFRAWCETDDGIEMIYFGKGEFDNGLWFDAPKHIDKYISINNMKQNLENFIIDNEKKIKNLSDEERMELGKIFLKGFQICENVRIDDMTLQKIEEEVFYPAENLTNIK